MPFRTNAGTFSFAGAESGGGYQCALNDFVWQSCGGGYTFPGALGAKLVQEAPNTFRVRASDVHGNWGAPASWNFIWDTTAPASSIAPIESPTTTRRPTFTFSAPHDGGGAYTWRCQLHQQGFGSIYAPCGSGASVTWQPAVDLQDGVWVVSAYATDSTGNADSSAATITFTVDTTGPAIAFGDAPSGTIEDDTPTFSVTSDDAAATFLCKVDGGAFAPCSVPFTTASLADGEHTVSIKARDALGNDGNTLTRTFTVARPASAPAANDTGGTQTDGGGTQTDTAGGDGPTGGTQGVAGGGEAVLQCVVPDLKGKKLGAARKALAAANCGVGKVKKRKAGRAKRGKVLRQAKKAGTVLPAGTKIRLVVGR